MSYNAKGHGVKLNYVYNTQKTAKTLVPKKRGYNSLYCLSKHRRLKHDMSSIFCAILFFHRENMF